MRRLLLLAALGLLLLGAAWRRAVTPPPAAFVVRLAEGACRDGSTARLAVLAAAGAPVAGRWPRPLLGVAAQHGRLEVMAWLLERGASVNTSGEQATPIELAAGSAPVEAVRWLLERGANPAYGGGRALPAAVRACRPEVARLLLQHGARKLAGEHPALSDAAASGCGEVDALRVAYDDRP